MDMKHESGFIRISQMEITFHKMIGMGKVVVKN